jgi:beta-glucanase (GH16 family)
VTPGEHTPAPAPSAGSLKGVHGHPSANIDYPKYEGFTLVLAEEFEQPIDLDNDPIWTWSDGGLREGSVRFRKEGIKFEDGKMKITVSKNDRNFPPLDSCSHASVEQIPYKPLISGEMRSRYNLFRYGRYEVRMKAPEVKHGRPDVNGNFIATMFAYRDANAHHWREIDFEVTGDQPNSVTTNLLSADGTKNWKAYLQDSRQPDLGKINVRQDFHTYMFEWTPSGVTWYVDGKVVRKGSRLKVPEMSTKIMMNLWIFTGGAFGGSQIYNNEYPFHSEYEYFRFYKWDGDDKYPCADLTNSCLTEDDRYLDGNNPCDGIPQEELLEGQRVCTAKCTGAASAHWGYK